MLIDHSSAFPTSTELPAGLRAATDIPAALAAALEGLDRGALTDLLGELISDRQIEALLARRDAILAQRAVARAATP